MNAIDCPTIRTRNAAGAHGVRDGATICLFVRRSHSAIAAAVIDALERFRAFSGDDAPRLYVDSEGDVARWTDEAAARTIAALREPAGASLQLLDSASGASGVSFRYEGNELEVFARDGLPNVVSAIEIGLSRELLEARGAGEVAAFATALASSLPVESGYASLALQHDGGAATFAELRHFCFNFPGLDILDSNAWMTIAGRVRGAYWLNFLGSEIAAPLGGLRSPALRTGVLPNGVVRVATTAEPSSGNLARRQNLPECRELAQILEPLLYHAPQPFPSFTPEETLRWERRFLSAG